MADIRHNIETPEMLASLVSAFRVNKQGALIRLNSGGGQKKGSIAGSLHRTGYVRIKHSGYVFQAHRVTYAISHNRWPEEYIDHVNGIKSDNRPINLRDANGAQNQWNTGPRTSGIKGVFYRKDIGKWRARIGVNGKQKTLGFFDTEEIAGDAYAKAALEFHGAFAMTAPGYGTQTKG